MIIAKVSNMIVGVSTWIGGDTYLYLDHIPMVQGQLKRIPNRITINKELKSLDDILSLTIDDFELSNYESYLPLKAKLFTGLKK